MAAKSLARLVADAFGDALGLDKKPSRLGLDVHYRASWSVEFTERGVQIDRSLGKGLDRECEQFVIEFADPEFEAKVRAVLNVVPEGWLTCSDVQMNESSGDLGNALGNARRASEGISDHA